MKKQVFIIFIYAFTLNAQATPQEKIILYNVNLINSTPPYVQDRMCIVIHANLIESIIKAKDYASAPGDKVYNLDGKYVIPGLIDGHVHLRSLPDIQLTNALMWGITSIRSMGDDASYIQLVNEAVKDNEFSGPDIYYSAGIGGKSLFEEDYRARLVTPSGYEPGEAPWLQMIVDTSDIQKMVQKAKDCGATGLKLLNYIKPDEVRDLVYYATKLGLKVWSHPHLTLTDSKSIAESGVDLITHTPLLLTPIDWNLNEHGGMAMNQEYLLNGRLDSILLQMKENDIMFEPTLSMFFFLINQSRSESTIMMKKEMAIEVLQRAWDIGIEFVAGTDVDLPQTEKEIPGLFKELEYYTDLLEITPLEALISATYNGAKAIGIERTHGSIETGKIADMVVLDKDPIRDISNLESVVIVVKNGKLIYRK